MQIYKIEIAKKAKKFIKKLPKHEAIKILEAIEHLKKEPRPRWIEKLKGTKNEFYRIPWGNYRMIYMIQDDILFVTIVKIDHRKDVYKN